MTAENRRILIVDDERPILLTLEALLGRHGYVTETVSRQQKEGSTASRNSAPNAL